MVVDNTWMEWFKVFSEVFADYYTGGEQEAATYKEITEYLRNRLGVDPHGLTAVHLKELLNDKD